ncbi:MAG: 4'-phosphopantetheinyl transferase family protein [Myxococcales bacterium]
MTTVADLCVLMQGLCDPVGACYAVHGVRSAEESAALARDEDELLQRTEQRDCATFRSFKRRAEFCAGRLAAKHALAQAPLRVSASEFELTRDALGAPRLSALVHRHTGATVGDRELEASAQSLAARTHVSISHSNGFAVAVAAPWRVGVDLELIDTRPNALVRYFFCPAEQRLLGQFHGNALQVAINRLWTRKESACKLLGRGARIALRDIDTSQSETQVGAHVMRWRTAVFGGFAASIAFPPDAFRAVSKDVVLQPRKWNS